MKSANLAWRIEPYAEPTQPLPAQDAYAAPRAELRKLTRPRPRFERRTIEIRDQGFALFRVR
jgi:hypothetical protein